MNEKHGDPPGSAAATAGASSATGIRGSTSSAAESRNEQPRWHGASEPQADPAPHGLEPGLRERKKQATRQALIAASMRLALEHGFENLRVEEIAATAGVSPRTFNNYFPSREAAICAARVDHMRQLAAAVRARPAEEALLDAIINTVRDNPREPDRAEFQLIHCNPTLRAEFLRTAAETEAPLIEAIAERTGTEPGHLLPQVAAAAVFGALRAALQQWLRSERPRPYHLVLCDALNQLRALATAPQSTVPEGSAPKGGAHGNAAPDRAGAPEPSSSSSAEPASGTGPNCAPNSAAADVSPVSGASAEPVNIGDRAA